MEKNIPKRFYCIPYCSSFIPVCLIIVYPMYLLALLILILCFGIDAIKVTNNIQYSDIQPFASYTVQTFGLAER